MHIPTVNFRFWDVFFLLIVTTPRKQQVSVYFPKLKGRFFQSLNRYHNPLRFNAKGFNSIFQHYTNVRPSLLLSYKIPITSTTLNSWVLSQVWGYRRQDPSIVLVQAKIMFDWLFLLYLAYNFSVFTAG